jgi:hypothetical protein
MHATGIKSGILSKVRGIDSRIGAQLMPLGFEVHLHVADSMDGSGDDVSYTLRARIPLFDDLLNRLLDRVYSHPERLLRVRVGQRQLLCIVVVVSLCFAGRWGKSIFERAMRLVRESTYRFLGEGRGAERVMKDVEGINEYVRLAAEEILELPLARLSALLCSGSYLGRR